MGADAERGQVAHEIHEAFRSEPPPRGTLIVDGADPGDAQLLRRALRGRRWTAVPRRLPCDERSGISWFTPEALRHYLPLWLLASTDDDGVRFWTVTQLGLAAQQPATFGARFAALTERERRAVSRFLRWVEAVAPDDAVAARAALPWWDRVGS